MLITASCRTQKMLQIETIKNKQMGSSPDFSIGPHWYVAVAQNKKTTDVWLITSLYIIDCIVSPGN